MHNECSDMEQFTKISRLELRLLGAIAIGYFTYRVGFINSLFGNDSAADCGAEGWAGIVLEDIHYKRTMAKLELENMNSQIAQMKRYL